MTSSVQDIQAFLARASEPLALIELSNVKGSSPREQGAWMLTSPNENFGTIGGGYLEFIALAKARELLAAEDDQPKDATLDIPLGPEIGQCCGGRVRVTIRLATPAVRQTLLSEASTEDKQRPDIFIFGGGHVGTALAVAFSLLPVRVAVIETRADALADIPPEIETRLTAIPEQIVRNAGANAAFIILTHDHALDFLIVNEALRRRDSAYVGMIGSKTKKATFKSWFQKEMGTDEEFARLVCPIGSAIVKDKRPKVIAALVVAEVIAALSIASN